MGDVTTRLRYTADLGGINAAAAGMGRLQGASGAMMNTVKMATLVVGGLGIAAIGAAATIGVKFASQLENAEIAFTTLTGSAEGAKKMLDDLKQFAKTTPFDFPELLHASQRLKAYGFEAEHVIPLLRTIGDATAALGTGAEGINRIVLALGQMKAAGRVMGQDMLQLTNANINAWELLAKGLGKTQKETRELAEKGLIPASQAIPILLQGMGKYAGMMDAQSKTFAGALSNIRDAARFAFGDIFQPLFEGLRDVAQAINRFTQTPMFQEWVVRIQQAVRNGFNWIIGEAFPALVGAVLFVKQKWIDLGDSGQKALLGIATLMMVGGPVISAIRGMTMALSLLPGPIWIILGAVVALGTAFTKALEPSLSWGDAFKKAWGPGLQLVGEMARKAALEASAAMEPEGAARAKLEIDSVTSAYIDQAHKVQALRAGIISVGDAMADTQAIMKEMPLYVQAFPPDLAQRLFPEEFDKARERFQQRAQQRTQQELNNAEIMLRLMESQLVEATAKWGEAAQTPFLEALLGFDKIKDKGAEAIRDWKRNFEEALRTMPKGDETDEIMDWSKLFVGAVEQIGDGTDKAGQKVEKFAVSVQDMADAFANAHPAVQIMNLRLVGLQDQLAAVNAAIEANSVAQRNMQDAISATQERIAGLNDRLTQARDRLRDLTQIRLPGQGVAEERIFQLEAVLRRLRLAELTGQPVQLTAAMRTALGGLALNPEAIQKALDILRLRLEDLTSDPMRRLREAAEGVQREMTFEDALRGIMNTRREINSLEEALRNENNTLRGQQEELRNLQRAAEDMRAAAAALQRQIDSAQQVQQLMVKALQAAAVWMIEDRTKMEELGGEAEAQAGIIDDKTQEMLALFDAFARGEANATIGRIWAVVDEWQRARDAINRIAGGIQGLPTPPPVPEEPILEGQHGGVFTRPTVLRIAEAGPETVLPVGASVGGGITVNINAQAFMGSRTEARAFARAIAELLNESQRTRLGIGTI